MFKKVVSYLGVIIVLFSAGIVFAAQEIKVPSGTTVLLGTVSTITTKNIAVGDRVAFYVVNDVVSDGKIIIKSGSSATGNVERFEKPKFFGVPAKLRINLASVPAVDGQLLPITGNYDFQGKRNTLQAVIGFIFFIPVKGKHLEIAADTRFEGTIPMPVNIQVD